MAIFLQTNGNVTIVSPKNGKVFKSKELHEFVDGYFEFVFLNEHRVLVVDEEGKLKGKEINHEATRLYWDNFRTNDLIVGDVLVCQRSELD